MRRFLLAGTLLLSGCASPALPAPPSFPADPWRAVTAIEHGAEVVIVVRCPGVDAAPCAPEGAEAVADGYRLEGKLLEASAASVLVATGTPDVRRAPIARGDIVKVFVEHEESRRLHMLIGAAVGTGLCAAAGLYGEGDIVFTGKVVFTGICAGGGAMLGYLANRDPTALRLVYERSDSASHRTGRRPAFASQPER